MFASPYGNPLLRFAAMPGVIDESGAVAAPMGSELNPGPAGPMLDSGPKTINLTDPGRYGRAPALFGGGPMVSSRAPNPSMTSPATAMAAPPTLSTEQMGGGGMFGGGKKPSFLQRFGPALAMMMIAATAKGNPMAGYELQGIMNQLAQRQKNAREDQQTAQYVQALVARGVDPNDAVIMAADPAEMAKHFGTRYDAATVDEGSSRYVPNLNGTTNVFTAPKTFQNKADVVQMPGSQSLLGDTSALGLGLPQPVGAPASIPGLRTEGEQFAASVGLQPGTPAYNDAIQNYELKAYGPNAQDMLGQRLKSQQALAAGHDATSAANNIRSTQTSASNNRYSVDRRVGGGRGPHAPTPSTVIGGIMAKQASGQPLTPSEQNTLREYRTHYKPQRGAVQISPNEAMAHDAHGRPMVVRGGKWVYTDTGEAAH
jgi:hypothetical protein